MEIPFDDDYQFMKSFSIEERDSAEVQDFFDTYGFIIFRDVLTEKECLDTIDDMWNLIQEQNDQVKRDDPSTWEKQFTTKFGMPNGIKALFRKSLLRLRQHPNVYQAFRAILNQGDKIICNHDRWLLNRPTRFSNGDVKKEWETPKNIHLDLNPFEFVDKNAEKSVRGSLSQFKYGNKGLRGFVRENNYVHKSFGRCVQGILNLQDLKFENVDSGGTIVVPGYHKLMEQEVARYDRSQEVVGPAQYRFGNCDLLHKAQRVCLAAGSLLIWDQRLAHGSTPNRCDHFRGAIPIRFFPLNQMDRTRRRERASVVSREIELVGFTDEVTDIGRIVFDLD